jgi:hypothetical protein
MSITERQFTANSIVVAWRAGNASPFVRAFVDLVRQAVPAGNDAARLTGRRRKA